MLGVSICGQLLVPSMCASQYWGGGGGGGGGGKLSLHLNDGWYDAVHGLGDDEEAVHVVLSGHVGSHKGEDGHDVV